MAGKQYEHSAVRGVRQIGDYLNYGCTVRRLILPRLWKIVRDPENALRWVVERRSKNFPYLYWRGFAAQTQPGFQERELPASGQGGTGKNDGAEAIEKQLTKHGGEVQRNRRQPIVLASGGSLHPTDGRSTASCRT